MFKKQAEPWLRNVELQRNSPQTISKLQVEVEELKVTNSKVQTTNTNLYQSLVKKSDAVKSLEVRERWSLVT